MRRMSESGSSDVGEHDPENRGPLETLRRHDDGTLSFGRQRFGIRDSLRCTSRPPSGWNGTQPWLLPLLSYVGGVGEKTGLGMAEATRLASHTCMDPVRRF